MKRKGLWNALFVVLCIALVVALGGMLSWGMKKDSKERERLEKLATESVKTNKETSGTSKKEEKEKGEVVNTYFQVKCTFVFNTLKFPDKAFYKVEFPSSEMGDFE